MKTLEQMVVHQFEQKQKRKWDHLYWAIDLHDTVVSGTYNRYNEGAILYPDAKVVLDYLYQNNDHRTILWTSSYLDSSTELLNRFDLKFHFINSNPDCPTTDLCNFDAKFYFNFLLDDKSGFDGKYDWTELKRIFKL